MKNTSFADHLDVLIRLFKKLREQNQDEQMAGMDRSFFQTVDILLQNYDLIKSTVPKEMLDQLGSPIHDVILELIKQLKQELGETGNTNETIGDILSEIEAIDEMLAEANLSSSEIDELLDERTKLMHQRDENNTDGTTTKQ